MMSFDMPRIAVDRDYIQSPLNANFPKAGNGASIHEPDDLGTGKVSPEDICLTIPIEVSDTNDGPAWPDISKRAGAGDGRPIHEPDHHISRITAPENVGLSIAVEVSRSDDGPVCSQVSDGGEAIDADS